MGLGTWFDGAAREVRSNELQQAEEGGVSVWDGETTDGTPEDDGMAICKSES